MVLQNCVVIVVAVGVVAKETKMSQVSTVVHLLYLLKEQSVNSKALLV